MATTVIEAILARFSASVAQSLTFSSNGLWFDEIPEDLNVENGPFVALVDVKDMGPEFATEQDYTEWTAFAFEVYATSLSVVVQVLAAIKGAFDIPDDIAAAAFPITGARVMAGVRGETAYRHVGERTATGTKVYMARMEYRMQARYTLPAIATES